MTKMQQAIALAKSKMVLTPQDLSDRDIPRQYIYRLEKLGLIEKDSSGLYSCTEGAFDQYWNYVQVAKKIPDGVICLLSALYLHDMTTAAPSRIWVAIPPSRYCPKFDYPQVQYVTMSGKYKSEGIETRKTEGGEIIKVFNPAKTVADCFRFRNKVGTDVAAAALKDYWREGKGTLGELAKYSEICQVRNVMKPYLEMLLAE